MAAREIITIIDANEYDDMDTIRDLLAQAGIELDDDQPEGSRIAVDIGDVPEVVDLITGLGFETDAF